MTRPFTPAQKFRILVHHRALIVVDGAFVPIARVKWGTESKTKRFALARKWGCAVQCACGCGVWAVLADVDFDHDKEHVAGGLTSIMNGRPLRRSPCHHAKNARGAAVTGQVRRRKRKLSVTVKRGESLAPAPFKRRSWPTRSLTNPNVKRRIPSSPMRSRSFPQRHEANT